MYRKIIRYCVILTLLLIMGTRAQAAIDPHLEETNPVVATMESALHAIEADNAEAFGRELSPGFYMYDNGQRFDAAGLLSLVKSVHASGTSIEWHVVSPDVHVDGKTAWISYLNEGTITSSAGSVHRRWLESAFLVKTKEGWKISFWHSSAAADVQSPH